LFDRIGNFVGVFRKIRSDLAGFDVLENISGFGAGNFSRPHIVIEIDIGIFLQLIDLLFKLIDSRAFLFQLSGVQVVQGSGDFGVSLCCGALARLGEPD